MFEDGDMLKNEKLKGWKTLPAIEVKSRLYLALFGIPEPLNVFKIEPLFQVSGQYFKGYTRPYIEVTLKEMIEEETVETGTISEEGKRPVITYRSNPDVYLDFLTDLTDVGKAELKEVRDVILGFAPVFNMIGLGDIPNIDALIDISICCYYPTYFVSNMPKEKCMEEVFKFLKETTNASQLRPARFLPFPLKPLTYTIVDRIYSYPKIEISQDLVEKALKIRHVFLRGIMASSFLYPGMKRKDFKKALRIYDQFMKKMSRRLGPWSGYPAPQSRGEKEKEGGEKA
jgi:hypothetical protein